MNGALCFRGSLYLPSGIELSICYSTIINYSSQGTLNVCLFAPNLCVEAII